MATLSPSEMVTWLEQNEFLTPAQGNAVRATLTTFADSKALAAELVKLDWLKPYQANQILQGNHEYLVLGDYRLLERIGDGAMGHVYKAWSRRLDRAVALKTIHKDRVNSPTAKKRFAREVEAAAQLAHPNIALVRDADEENNRPFLVMDYIEGVNLSARVKQQGAVPIQDAAEYIRQAALGLQHAFERGVVHRDIKPANLMVVANKAGETKPLVKILDFGLARFESEQEQSTRITQLGNLLGTVDYVAPEQAQNASGADIRADIYSLGCTLFYLLTARPPFSGDTLMERLSPRITGEAPWVRTLKPEVPPGLEDIVRKMMSRLPDDRYQTPIEVAQALAPYAGVPAVAPSVTPPPTSPVVMATPVLAMPVMGTPINPDANVPMAMPIPHQPIETPPLATLAANDMASSNRNTSSAKRLNASNEPASNQRWPLKWVAIAGIGIGLISVGCVGISIFWFRPPPPKNASIIITEKTRLSTPNQTVQPGDIKFVLVYIERMNFEGPVKISLDQLPNGVIGKSKVIPGNQASADVSFTVSHGTDPITTNIRIVAECEAKSAYGERMLPFTIVAEKKK